ncbi:MAG TPA: hypothetical protein VGH28_11775 [Polyangiaceae bacterium]|jgi:metal-responsive CopG/Arc/MetJ family transcriptional regulator
MASGVAKISISLPRDLAKALARRVGARSVSEFAARAIRHELEHERLGALLGELDENLGPVAPGVLEEARAAWRKS